MKFTEISGDCEDKNCPAVYRTDRGSELVDDPDLEHYRAQRGLALAQAVPFDRYWSAHPQYHRD